MGEWVPPTKQEQDEIRKSEAVDEAERERTAAENRNHARLSLTAKVTMASQSNFFSGFTENVSEGGIFVSTLSPPEVGTMVGLKVAVGDGEPIDIEGEVRWLRSDEDGNYTGCGVKFLNLSAEVSAAIDGLVRALERDPLLYDV